MQIPEEYRGREQAFVKHSVLKAYLPKLFMIIGRGKETVINYVDCFAGPWKENDESLSDTSIGISLAEMARCRQGLLETFGSRVTFRALYVEQDSKAFRKLQQFLTSTSYEGIETKCLEGDYTTHIDEIVCWCGPNFTFFFVDPKGWLDVIGAEVLRPLLTIPRAEFLITLMYDFLNRAANIDRHQQDMITTLGGVPELQNADSDGRRSILLQMYRDSVNDVYKGRSTFVSVQKPGKDRVHYFLVYLTRASVGLIKFKEIAEVTELLQREIQTEVRIRHKSDKSGTPDLFAGGTLPMKDTNGLDLLTKARAFLAHRFSGKQVLIDQELWADLLEETDFFPSELQQAMKSMATDGLVQNLDADISRRRKNIVKPDYERRSERWRFTG